MGAAPVTYELDPAHTHVGFQIRHLVSKVSGQFDRFTGTLVYDPDSPTTSKVEAAIETASIDTNNEKRDGHLKSADFFEPRSSPHQLPSKSVTVHGRS